MSISDKAVLNRRSLSLMHSSWELSLGLHFSDVECLELFQVDRMWCKDIT